MTESNPSTTADVSAESLGISSDLLAILVCPVDHGKLEVVSGGLRCTVCQRTYAVEDGIPNMVVDANGEGER
jgi:uncharacterized protein YbaR (Trm112 family)